MDLNGHEAGNGGYSQGKPTACRDLLYSENRVMVFVLDNYDSFTYNLVQYLGELGARSKFAATTR